MEYGTYINGRVVLINTNSAKRTDETFSAMIAENHHIRISPLSQLNIGLVSLVPIDYMHAVCLGVTKKLLNTCVGGNLKVRLPSRSTNILSQKILSLKNHVPKEINRKPRDLSELPRWKATEFRTFLLYLGPLVLKNLLDIAVYEHFLLLHAGISILCSPKLINTIGTHEAKNMLNCFVFHCKEIYGKQFYVYNVHVLSHLSDDAETFGPLDLFSAFPFENRLGQIKHYLKSPNRPIQQIYCRLIESNYDIKVEPSGANSEYTLLYEHNSGPVLNNVTI